MQVRFLGTWDKLHIREASIKHLYWYYQLPLLPILLFLLLPASEMDIATTFSELRGLRATGTEVIREILNSIHPAWATLTWNSNGWIRWYLQRPYIEPVKTKEYRKIRKKKSVREKTRQEKRCVMKKEWECRREREKQTRWRSLYKRRETWTE